MRMVRDLFINQMCSRICMKRSLSERILRKLSRYEMLRTNTELSRELKADPAQVSSVTNRLEKKGKISRTDSIPRLYYIDTTGWNQGDL